MLILDYLDIFVYRNITNKKNLIYKSSNMDNFDFDTITEIALLIGNKRNENFALEIDKIYLN